jgi:hypothetical protein
MRRRRKWLRRIGRVAGTVTIGLLIGFLVPTVAKDLAPQPEIQASVPEAPLARQFINAFTADDKGALDQLKVRADIALRASRFRADYTRVDSPIHLGSFVAGGYSVHAYGIHVVRRDGTEDTLSWRVVTSGGQVGLILPPSPIESE